MTTLAPALAQPAEGLELDETARHLIDLLCSGGDARITLKRGTSLNKYLSAPYPRSVTAYASSTANDISAEAFAFLRQEVEGSGSVMERESGSFGASFYDQTSYDYAAALDQLRRRIRAAYALSSDVEIVFAPSGTDLEYVALSLAAADGTGGVHNVLLGADEVGSGCIHSAHGRYFAEETALGHHVEPAQAVEGIGPVSLADIPLRCEEGEVQTSAQITEQIRAELDVASMGGRKALLHVVHGSKTGLILPNLADIDRLQTAYNHGFQLVIDACQARITPGAVADYLDRDAIVFLTGSKFMGGPPFSGFALVPASLAQRVAAQSSALPAGFSHIFRRSEWPAAWPGAERLEDSANQGLALRLSASIFELERFSAISQVAVRRSIEAFRSAVQEELCVPLGLPIVEPHRPGDHAAMEQHPIEMQTLMTLDVSSLPAARTFDDAQVLHKLLAKHGVRLGQPVKSVRSDCQWSGTLRVGISMPQISRWALMSEADCSAALRSDMRLIAKLLRHHGTLAK